MRPGYKTTEFWLSAVASTVGMLMASGVFTTGLIGQALGLLAAVLSGIGYSFVRGGLKKKEYEASSYRGSGSINLEQPSSPTGKRGKNQ